jgi:hypothetical protein
MLRLSHLSLNILVFGLVMCLLKRHILISRFLHLGSPPWADNSGEDLELDSELELAREIDPTVNSRLSSKVRLDPVSSSLASFAPGRDFVETYLLFRFTQQPPTSKEITTAGSIKPPAPMLGYASRE